MDATKVDSQEKRRKKLTVKLAVMYSGKELESEAAKYKRYQIKFANSRQGFEEALERARVEVVRTGCSGQAAPAMSFG